MSALSNRGRRASFDNTWEFRRCYNDSSGSTRCPPRLVGALGNDAVAMAALMTGGSAIAL